MSFGRTESSKQVCVIASNRRWNEALPARLTERTGVTFKLFTAPEQLTASALSSLNPLYVFFPHWSYKVDTELYEKFECVVFHMTDLPFGRGGSPLQNLIVFGFTETKISAIRCEEAVDAGPVYMKRPLSLYGSAEEIYMRASEVIEEMIAEIVARRPEPQPQRGQPTTFRRRTADQGDLAGASSLEEAFDLIRMLDAEGYPPAFVDVGGLRLEFTRATRKVDCVVADVSITLAARKSD